MKTTTTSSDLFIDEDDLSEALQDAWTDHCTDTGHIPGFLSFTMGENGEEIQADFLGSHFSTMVAALLNSRNEEKSVAIEADRKPLEWRKGPAHEDFDSESYFWGDGERILVIVKYSDGEKTILVDTSCDEHYSVLNLLDGTFDDSGVCPEEVIWWAAVNPDNWPSLMNNQDQTSP